MVTAEPRRMQYLYVFVSDARAVEKIETAEFADDQQARGWAEALAAARKVAGAIELWAPPRLVERYVVLEDAEPGTAASQRERRGRGTWLDRFAALFRLGTGST